MNIETDNELQLDLSTWVVLSFVLGGLAKIFEITWLAVPGILFGLWALVLGIYFIRKRMLGNQSFSRRIGLSVIAAAFFSGYAYDLLTDHIF